MFYLSRGIIEFRACGFRFPVWRLGWLPKNVLNKSFSVCVCGHKLLKPQKPKMYMTIKKPFPVSKQLIPTWQISDFHEDMLFKPTWCALVEGKPESHATGCPLLRYRNPF